MADGLPHPPGLLPHKVGEGGKATYPLAPSPWGEGGKLTTTTALTPEISMDRLPSIRKTGERRGPDLWCGREGR
jgi:hypothetical protein